MKNTDIKIVKLSNRRVVHFESSRLYICKTISGAAIELTYDELEALILAAQTVIAEAEGGS